MIRIKHGNIFLFQNNVPQNNNQYHTPQYVMVKDNANVNHQYVYKVSKKLEIRLIFKYELYEFFFFF